MTVAVEHLGADGYREAIVWTPANYDGGHAFYEATGWEFDSALRNEGREVRYRRRLERASP